MRPEQYMPAAMILISIASAVVYAYQRDWRHAVYWAAAAVLTASVTV